MAEEQGDARKALRAAWDEMIVEFNRRLDRA